MCLSSEDYFSSLAPGTNWQQGSVASFLNALIVYPEQSQTFEPAHAWKALSLSINMKPTRSEHCVLNYLKNKGPIHAYNHMEML